MLLILKFMKLMNSKPLISIITPLYNCEHLISFTIESILSQTYTNWELIIIDDNSTDNSFFVANSYNDKRISVYKNELNKGVAYTRNLGLEKSKGNFICFLDSDDYWDSKKLELQLNHILKLDEPAILTCAYQKVDYNGNLVGNIINMPNRVVYKDLLKTNSIPCLTVLFSASLGKKFKFREIGHEDYVFWLDVLKDGHVVHTINNCLAYYRIGNSSLSSNKIKAASFQWKIYRNYLKFSFLKSIYYFIHYFIFGLKKYIS